MLWISDIRRHMWKKKQYAGSLQQHAMFITTWGKWTQTGKAIKYSNAQFFIYSSIDMGWYSCVSVGGAVGHEQRWAAPKDLLPAANQGVGRPTSPHVWRDHPLLPGVSLQQLHTGNMTPHMGVSWESWGVAPSRHHADGAYSKIQFENDCLSAVVLFHTIPQTA